MPATLVWFSGLETGGPVGGLGSEFDAMSNGGGGTPTYQTLTKRTGTYGLLTPHDGLVRIRANFASNATTFLRCYFRVTSNPAATIPIVVSANSTSSTARGWRVFLTLTGILGWSFNNLGNSPPDATGGPAVSLTGWNLLEVKFVRDVAVGGMEIFLNGTLVVSDFTHATTSGTSLTTTVLFFGDDTDQPGTNRSAIDINWDDFAFATGQYIGAGGSVAVQGKSGAPTYNAWTKNGAADSFGAWSQTPWDSTKNCSDTVSADRQTMLVDGVTLQSLIAAGSVINGAMIGMVGHSTTATGNAARTRRIGGVDTDGANRNVPLTTDTFMPQGQNLDPTEIFVDTLANLAAAEIGVVRGPQNAGNAVTIEDVWLMVDFAPPAAPSLNRDEALPVEWLTGLKRDELLPVDATSPSNLIRRDELLPVELFSNNFFIVRDEKLPVEWTGGPQGSLLLIWSVRNKLFVPFVLTWNVISKRLVQQFQLKWTVRQSLALQPLVLRWNVIPNLVPIFTGNDIQLPTITITKTP